MITAAKLKTRTVKDLAAMAKRKGVRGWHSMRKDQLVRALARLARADASKVCSKGEPAAKKASAKSASGATKKSHPSLPAPKPRSPRIERSLERIRTKLAESKDLAFRSENDGNGRAKDRLVVMVRDSFWLHAYWELSRRTVDRARAAMGQHWHGAKPILRVSEVVRDGTTNTAKRTVRDIEIHGGVDNWYIDVSDPPKSYQLDVGYLASDGKFFSLARSNSVSTPPAGAARSVDDNWAGVAEDYDRVYAMSGGYSEHSDNRDLKELFEERMHRPMGSPMATRFGPGAGRKGRNEFDFEVDAALIVFGVTDPNAHVTLKGQPVRLRPDGSFYVQFTLPDRRQVLPVVASSGDGVQQQTIVLAVERNTKIMEPVIREPDE